MEEKDPRNQANAKGLESKQFMFMLAREARGNDRTRADRRSNCHRGFRGHSGLSKNAAIMIPERRFFLGMSILIFGTVVLGFARTYYLAGLFRAPLPTWIIHVHGAVFSTWIMFLVVQTSFVSMSRVDIHRRLGMVGFGLASLMVVLGTCAATDALRRGVTDVGTDAQTFYAGNILDMLIFGTFVFFAFRLRRNPAAHKRLILLATFLLMDAPISRWPFEIFQRLRLMTYVGIGVFLLLLIVYDLLSLGKVHRTTLAGGSFLITALVLEYPIGRTAAWHTIAAWAQAIANSIHGA